jgi:F-type H+-transporting ATPase subunit gamma
MASTRDIRRRIKSVKNTRQITKAMELVAASKMKRAQQATLAGRPYAQLMAEMLGALASRVDEAQHPFLTHREVKTRGVLLITTNIGLCGALNANLLKQVTEIKSPVKYVTIGRKGTQFIARTKRDLIADFKVDDRGSFNEVKVAVEFMMKQFLDGVIDTIEVLYPRFKNTLVQQTVLRPVLPLTNVRDFIQNLQTESGAVSKPQSDEREILFEPNAPQVLEALLPFYVNRYIHN